MPAMPSPYTTLFFDLDDTLYPSHTGVWDAIQARMTAYMAERLGLPAAEIPHLRLHYYHTYGTTLRGLQQHYQVDAEDYMAYVHDLPLDRYLAPDPALRALLLSLPQSRWVFTNADEAHAGRVLAALGLEGCFRGVIDVRATAWACKPEVSAYRTAMALAGERDPERCVLFDDSPRNLAPARALGFTTVLVREGAAPGDTDPSAALIIPGLPALAECMPELWGQGVGG